MNNTTATVPHQVITPDDHGGYITITAAMMLVATALFYIFRLVIRFGFGFFASDDTLITAGTVSVI
jgi:hypothetical protein